MSMEIFTSRSGRAPGSFAWRAAAARWAEIAGPLARDAVKAKAPVGAGPNAGRLKSGMRSETHWTGGGLQVWIGSSAPEARFVRDGTKPHEIVPSRARALHFTAKGGAEVFTRRVRHPGTKPNPFAKDALRRVAPALEKLFSDVMREALGGPL